MGSTTSTRGGLGSRERVDRALRRQEADRVAVDLGSTPFTTLHRLCHENLVQLLGLQPVDTPFISFSAQVVEPHPDIVKLIGADFYGLYAKPGSRFRMQLNEEDDSYFDEWGIQYRRPAGSYQYDFTCHPLRNASRAELDSYAWPDPRDPARIAGLAAEARRVHEETDLALVLNPPAGCQVMALHSWLTGFERFFTDMVLDRPFAEELGWRLVDWHMSWLEMALPELADYLSVVALADDLGAQQGPQIRPSVYRDLYKPMHARIISYIKKNSNARVFFHSCGSVKQFIPDLIEIGVDALNPVQVSAAEMDSADLKRDFGDRISFWGGGCDSQAVLPFGSIDDVAHEVERRVADLMSGGGYVFAPVHNVQADVSPQKVVVMYETALKRGCY